MTEVYEFLKNSKIFYLATIDNDRPRVRPFGAINIFEDKLYIQTGKRKDVSKQMSINPKIEISSFYNGSWIRLEAEAYEDDRVEAKKSMLDNNPELRAMYNELDDNTEVLYLKNAKATICSFTSEPKVIEF